jgi:hypothetical protein
MGSDKESRRGSKSHEKTAETYRSIYRQRAKAFIVDNELVRLLGIENESDIAKKIIYLRLVRGSVIQQLLAVDVDRKCPGVIDQALATQISLNEDAQHSRLANAVALCDISSDIGNLFTLMKRDDIKIGKDMPPVNDKTIRAWDASSMLPVIEPQKITA